MSEFKIFQEAIQKQFDKMSKNYVLFQSTVTGREIYELYLKGFKNGTDPIFRDPESSTHRCNTCNNFIRRYGNIISINENFEIESIFSNLNLPEDNIYLPVAKGISDVLENSGIENVFIETLNNLKELSYENNVNSNQKVFRLGIDKNTKRYTREEAEKFGGVKPNEIRIFHHFHLDVDQKFIDFTGKSLESLLGNFKTNYEVFSRGLNEISLYTLILVQDLIQQNSIINGESYIKLLKIIITEKEKFNKLEDKSKSTNYLWKTSTSFNESVCKFRNTLLGTLCVELEQGVDLKKACLDWNKRADPINYMKATAPITKQQIKEAEKFVTENGYEASFSRRAATFEDVSVSEILHKNISKDKIKNFSLFDNVNPTKNTEKKNSFEGVKEFTIQDFMENILPKCTQVEILFEDRMKDNLVALMTSQDKDSKEIFNWSNNYSWTYSNNLTGKSYIKQAVKEKGGNVEGVLNCRLAWNESGKDNSDLDLWAKEPDGTKIGYYTSYLKSERKRSKMSGQLDVDVIYPNGKLAVENITWDNLLTMQDGEYMFWVNPYNKKNSQGFKCEIEFDGNLYYYEYNKHVNHEVKIATVIKKGKDFDIVHHLPEKKLSNTVWNKKTNEFHKVKMVSLSPNYWGDNEVGNKHYFFMLENCHFEDKLKSFHVEYLKEDIRKHRKVMEVLTEKTKVEPSTDSLCGLGFNSTVPDSVILKLSGNYTGIVKINF